MSLSIHSAAWQRLRRVVLWRDRYCVGYPLGYHGTQAVRTNSVDHIVARSHGGSDALDNLRGLCVGCNTRKSIIEEGSRPR